MSIEDQLKRTADAAEAIQELLTKILAVISDQPSSLTTGADSPKAGYILTMRGVVSDVNGGFVSPSGEIDLERPHPAKGMRTRLWNVLVREQKAQGEPNAVSVAFLHSFLSRTGPSPGGEVRHYTPAMQGLLEDWAAQLDDLLK